MDFLPIKEAADSFGLKNQEWYIHNLIIAGQVFGKVIPPKNGIDVEEIFVSKESLKNYLDKKKKIIEEDPTAIPGYSLENPAPQGSDPDAIFLSRPDFTNTNLLQAKTALTVVQAKRAQYELDKELRPIISSLPAESFDEFRKELIEDLQQNKKEIQKFKNAIKNPNKNSRQDLLEYGILERLQLVLAEMDQLRLLIRSSVSISDSHFRLLQAQMKILEQQAAVLTKMLTKQMPDLKAVDKDYSEEVSEDEDKIEINIISNGEKRALVPGT